MILLFEHVAYGSGTAHIQCIEYAATRVIANLPSVFERAMEHSSTGGIRDRFGIGE
jgi:hypothetical protein